MNQTKPPNAYSMYKICGFFDAQNVRNPAAYATRNVLASSFSIIPEECAPKHLPAERWHSSTVHSAPRPFDTNSWCAAAWFYVCDTLQPERQPDRRFHRPSTAAHQPGRRRNRLARDAHSDLDALCVRCVPPGILNPHARILL